MLCVIIFVLQIDAKDLDKRLLNLLLMDPFSANRKKGKINNKQFYIYKVSINYCNGFFALLDLYCEHD